MDILRGKITLEIPESQILKRTDDYEVRQYGEQICASIESPSSRLVCTDGFLPLVSFLHGKNTKSSINDASSKTSEGIAMTAPTLSNYGRRDDGSIDREVVVLSLTMPKAYKSIEQVPKPKSDKIRVHTVPETTYAIIKFSGKWSERATHAKLEQLRAWIEADSELKLIDDEPILARYNSPMTLYSKRTNEVWLRVKYTPSSEATNEREE